LATGVGVKGFPTPSRAAPKKKGTISTETPWVLRRGRKRIALVNPNQEYGDTEVCVSWEIGEIERGG
jgi:hypothetical protein